MELLQLKYFQILARNPRMTLVAKQLNIAQPSLSIMISRLENELGVKLFDRNGRKIILNDYGRIFLKHVDIILNEINLSKKELESEAGNESKRLTLATTGTTFLSGLLKKFLVSHKDIKIRQFITTTDEAIEYLKTGQADFSITSPPIYDESVETHILDYDEILLAVPINHKLASKKSVDLAELKNENFIDLIGHYNFRKITDKMCEMAGFKPNIIFEGEIPLMAEMLEAGQGIALIPKSLSNFYPNFPAVAVKIKKPVYKRIIALSWYKKSYESPIEKNFREFTIEYFRSHKGTDK